jgi:uncharacterized FlaG/YvyC family protein
MEVRSVTSPEQAALEAATRAEPRPPETRSGVRETEATQQNGPSQVELKDVLQVGQQPPRGGTKLHVDEATDRVVATIVDQSKQVIKQIPPKEQLDVIARTRALQGLLFDEIV